MLRPIARHLLSAALVALACAAPASAQNLTDSTVVQAWRLPNGLEVRTRHVPGAGMFSITLGYRAGSLYLPADREGMAELLAELQFTSPAGDVPERSRGELDQLRPLGWQVVVNDHLALLTEVASPAQLPGVLRQVSTRMRGVQATDSSFTHSLAAVRRDLGGRAFGNATASLYYRARALARGMDDAALLRVATGGALDGLTRAQATEALAQLYVPANASLAIAGDFSNFDVHAVVEHEFAAIPGGTTQPDTTSPRLSPGTRTWNVPGLDSPVGCMAVIAPALEDSLHPGFYLTTLMAGSYWASTLKDSKGPLESLFHYSVLDEPDLARFSLSPQGSGADTTAITATWNKLMTTFTEMAVRADDLDMMRANVDWVLGGPLSPEMRQLARTQPAVLSAITTSMATRARWHDDTFWDRYRRRFETERHGHSWFLHFLTERSRHAVVMLAPKR